MENIKTNTLSIADEALAFEHVQTKVALDDTLPICVRIDGKNFSKYTKVLKKPYDERLSKVMIDTMNFLVEETHAKLGYTQSDEITLLYFNDENSTHNFYGSRVQKLTSILASMATAKFNYEINLQIPEKNDQFAFFDCRIWNVPTLKDAANVFIWRQDDAVKNAISMAAHSVFGHKTLQNKGSREKIELLASKGFIWNDYPEFFKSGTYAKRQLVELPMPEEMKKFKANKDKDTFIRSEIINYNNPRLSRIKNIEDFLFQQNATNSRPKLGM